MFILVSMATSTPRKRRTTSGIQKDAFLEGREQSKIVRRYLEAIELSKPKRGRKRTLESINKQLAAIDATLQTTNPLNRLVLIQKRIELTAELENIKNAPNLEELEAQFVSVAQQYSRRKGITFPAWKELGVHQDVLARAGITHLGRTERKPRVKRDTEN